MKIGMITDSLPDTDFDTMLAIAARLEMDMLEFGCGNWSTAPHLELDRLLESATARRDFRARLADHGIAISALNCSGNPVHPGEPGRRHDEVTRKTIRLAGLLDVDRVVMMSGCPGAPGDSHANWITTEWPPEVREIAALAVGRRADSVLARSRRVREGPGRRTGSASSCTATRTSTTSRHCSACATPSAKRSARISIPAT